MADSAFHDLLFADSQNPDGRNDSGLGDDQF